MSEKNRAKVILMKCPEGDKIYGVRIEEYEGDWYRTWAFPLDPKKASREGYDKNRFSGNLWPADEYPGCPHCKAVSFLKCETCGKLSCWTGQEKVKCPWCGTKGRIMQTDKKMEFGGGDM